MQRIAFDTVYLSVFEASIRAGELALQVVSMYIYSHLSLPSLSLRSPLRPASKAHQESLNGRGTIPLFPTNFLTDVVLCSQRREPRRS